MFFITHSDSFLESGGVYNRLGHGEPRLQLTPLEFNLLSRMTQSLDATSLTVDETAAAERLMSMGLLRAIQSAEEAGPNLWEKYGWGRARRVVLEAMKEREVRTTTQSLSLSGEIKSSLSFEHLPQLLHRSCARFFRPEPVETPAFMNFVKEFQEAISDLRWLKAYVVIQGVKGFQRRVYDLAELNRPTLNDNAPKYRAAALLECVQNQWWCGGPGFCVFLTVNLREINLRENGSQNYIDLYVRLGEVGQELIHAGYCNGLSGWMTPAVRESNVCELLCINQSHEEPLYFFKFALRDTEFEKKYGTDGLSLEKCDYEKLKPYDRKTQRVHKVVLGRRDLRSKNRPRKN